MSTMPDASYSIHKLISTQSGAELLGWQVYEHESFLQLISKWSAQKFFFLWPYSSPTSCLPTSDVIA